jgi:hypothetical protein
MSPDREPHSKPHRKRVDDVVVGKTVVKDGIKGNRRITPLIHIEPQKGLEMTADKVADLETFVQSAEKQSKPKKKKSRHNRGKLR